MGSRGRGFPAFFVSAIWVGNDGMNAVQHCREISQKKRTIDAIAARNRAIMELRARGISKAALMKADGTLSKVAPL